MVLAPEKTLSPEEARERLSAEWRDANPSTPDEIAEFYRDSEALEDDLIAFHTSPERQRWTDVAVHVARTPSVERVVDIGCGAGHDLAALAEALPDLELCGVEPNDTLRNELYRRDVALMVASVLAAPIEDADLLLCFDVLEHVVDPEAFLTSIATRAKIGCMLVETVATEDCGTPLHLKENRGWHPGRALEMAGWARMDQEGRLRVWHKIREGAVPRGTLMLCANRSISIPTFRSILSMQDALSDQGWRVYVGGEAGIHRARNIAATRWFQETADDVFVMVDDDVTFHPRDLERIADRCRNGYPLICAAYPVRDGGHLALRGMNQDVTFGPEQDPIEIGSMATGFVAIHRKVIEAVIKDLPLCHAMTSFAFYPMFDFRTVQDSHGEWEHLSEDYSMSLRAREAGFPTYLDPTIILGHLGLIEISVRNMQQVHAAVKAK